MKRVEEAAVGHNEFAEVSKNLLGLGFCNWVNSYTFAIPSAWHSEHISLYLLGSPLRRKLAHIGKICWSDLSRAIGFLHNWRICFNALNDLLWLNPTLRYVSGWGYRRCDGDCDRFSFL